MTTVRFIVLITLLIIPAPAPGEETGLTPLHRAAGKGDGDAVQVLVEAGADVEAKDEDGRRCKWRESMEALKV